MAKPKTSLALVKTAPLVPTDVLAPESAAMLADFDHARRCLGTARAFFLQATGFMIIAGLELKRLKKIHGVKRGGDRKSDQTQNRLGLMSWGKIVEAQLGISDETAAKYVKMADHAKARLAILKEMEQELLSTPLIDLPEDVQQKVFLAVKNSTDKVSAGEFMEECGIARKSPGITAGNRNKGGNSTKKKETLAEQAQSKFFPIHRMLHGHRIEAQANWLALLYQLPLEGNDDTVGLADIAAEFEAWTAQVKEAIKRISKAMHGSKEQDGGKRLKAAQEEAFASIGQK